MIEDYVWKKRWRGPLSEAQMLDIPQQLRVLLMKRSSVIKEQLRHSCRCQSNGTTV